MNEENTYSQALKKKTFLVNGSIRIANKEGRFVCKGHKKSLILLREIV